MCVVILRAALSLRELVIAGRRGEWGGIRGFQRNEYDE